MKHRLVLDISYERFYSRLSSRIILITGTDVNALDNLGKTPLHLALSRLRLIKSGKMLSNQQLKEEVSNVGGGGRNVIMLICNRCVCRVML